MSDERCSACRAIASASSQDALFFLAYAVGADDACATPETAKWMCSPHAEMRDKILDILEAEP